MTKPTLSQTVPTLEVPPLPADADEAAELFGEVYTFAGTVSRELGEALELIEKVSETAKTRRLALTGAQARVNELEAANADLVAEVAAARSHAVALGHVVEVHGGCEVATSGRLATEGTVVVCPTTGCGRVWQATNLSPAVPDSPAQLDVTDTNAATSARPAATTWVLLP